ncbi:MAG: hypothetical protein OEQ39_00160 [Gammaproteobacteria bacterium]|nr:hypothetical protein [Gammaproteobacteria bacterium]
MGDLTANLSRSEFACKCDRPECNRTPVDFHLASGLQRCVDYFAEQAILDGFEIERVACHINSGYRCLWYDAKLKGKNPQDFNGIKKSEHVWGIAADFWLEYVFIERDSSNKNVRRKIDDNKIATYLEAQYIGAGGIGRYDGRTHFDVRPGPAARWDNRGKR